MLVLPRKSAKIWDKFIRENRTLVYRYMVRQIIKGIQNNDSIVELFEFEGSDVRAWVPKANYLQTLQEALRVFIEAEAYEDAARVAELINTHYIDQIIKDTSTE